MRSLLASLMLLSALAVVGARTPTPGATVPQDSDVVGQQRRSVTLPNASPAECPCADDDDRSPEAALPIEDLRHFLPSALDDFTHDDGAIWHAHGNQACKSGCAASNHPTLDLADGEFHRLLGEYASSPADENTPAFEALLYYGKQTRDLLAREGSTPLDEPHRRRLSRELARTHARISVRIVDGDERRRVWLPPTRVPLDRRHVFTMETVDLQPLVTSGTVKRVGQDYLWVRL